MKIYIPILVTIMFILNVSCEQMHSIGEKKVEAKNNPQTPLDTARKYNNIAAEFIRNARTTGDFSLNSNAESSIKKALEIDPENFESKKLQASLHLTFHRFEEALKLGTELQKEAPEDSFIYGVLTDANVELGNYEAAVSKVQKMVDLKPNMSSYTRVAHVRSLHGDAEGAIESFTTATKIADPADIEAQAWCFVNLGNEQFKIGKYADAEKSYDKALEIFPSYPAGLVGKAQVLANKGNYENAIAFYVNAQNKTPLTETVIELGNIYAKTNDTEKAKQQYQLAEVIEQKLGNTDQRRLALLWADNDEKLTEALEIATKEHSLRKDIFTADIFAWCLYKNGKFAEAKVAITEAMRLKTKDARIFYHAGMIEKKLGNEKEGKRLLNLALLTNSSFDILQTDKAKLALKDWNAGGSPARTR
jgi:tetratricopeptide (TPR) repeat protein